MGLMMVLVSGAGVAAVVRTKLAGLTKSLVKSPPDEALERFEKIAGSTFSESISKDSAFRFPMGVLAAGEAISSLLVWFHSSSATRVSSTRLL
jgi:hypothetical protein